jgi:predicted lipoprotein with Yx(FWY)xxD motif
MRLAHVGPSHVIQFIPQRRCAQQKISLPRRKEYDGSCGVLFLQANCMTGDIMTSPIRLALTLAVSLALVPAALAAPPTKTGKTDKGNVLTDAKGMSLYTFDKDADGKSVCNGPCATNWPALKAEASDAAADGYTIITRDDGSKQWAHKGKPLYTFAKDQKAGDITGDGFLNGAWHLAMP